jgi:hypothetical protein
MTLEKAAMVGRTISPSIDWYPPPHKTLSVTENMAFHFLSYYRLETYLLRNHSRFLEVDVAATLETCRSVIIDITSLLPEDICRPETNADREPDDAEITARNRMKDNLVLQGRSFAFLRLEGSVILCTKLRKVMQLQRFKMRIGFMLSVQLAISTNLLGTLMLMA